VNEREQEIIDAAREFAEAHNIHFDEKTEFIVLNAMREYVQEPEVD